VSEADRVELIREGFAAWERGDVAAALANYHEDVVTYAPPEVGNAGTYHGIDGFLRWTQDWLEAWETFEQELVSVEPLGERHAIARVDQHGVGKGSGIEVNRQATYVYEIREGKLTFLSIFFDHDAALALVREREGAD
jgi:ketosteroid isomerase-like protein